MIDGGYLVFSFFNSLIVEVYLAFESVVGLIELQAGFFEFLDFWVKFFNLGENVVLKIVDVLKEGLNMILDLAIRNELISIVHFVAPKSKISFQLCALFCSDCTHDVFNYVLRFKFFVADSSFQELIGRYIAECIFFDDIIDVFEQVDDIYAIDIICVFWFFQQHLADNSVSIFVETMIVDDLPELLLAEFVDIEVNSPQEFRLKVVCFFFDFFLI